MYEKLLRVFKKRTKFADKGFIVNISATVMTLEKPWNFYTATVCLDLRKLSLFSGICICVN